MKRKVVSLLIGISMILPVSALAIELTDYMDVDIFYQDAELGAGFYLKDGNQDQVSYNGNVSLMYDMEHSTIPFKWNVEVDGNSEFSRGPNENDDSKKNIFLNANTTAKKYLGDYKGVFGFGRLDLGIRDIEDSHDNDPYSKVTLGAGYGRIITATPLMEAVRCVEDLTKYGIITGQVSDETYMKLAEVIAKESEYRSRYSLREYEKYWYEAMEKVLKDAGILKNDTLGAMGIIRIQDILTDEGVLRRRHGWEIGAGIDYLISDYSGNDGDPGLSAFFEYAKPFGFKWQLIDRLEYSTILKDWEFGDTAHKFTNQLSMTYEITDKIDWVNMWQLDVILETESDVDDTYQNALETGFRYYLTNALDAVTTLRLDHIDQGDNENDEVDITLFFGLVYTIF